MKYVYCILAGACDAVTGWLLIFAPGFALRLMQIDTAPAEPVYMRWIGAFVFSVGACYFLPFRSRDERRFVFMLEMTAWIRLVICSFVTAAVLRHALAAPWLVVAVTDGVLAAAQAFMLQRKVFERGI